MTFKLATALTCVALTALPLVELQAQQDNENKDEGLLRVPDPRCERRALCDEDRGRLEREQAVPARARFDEHGHALSSGQKFEFRFGVAHPLAPYLLHIP
jgi:hypothetical protein